MSNILFALKASLVDLQNRRIPYFDRPTELYLERITNNSIQLEAIAANEPAFYFDDGSFVLEPSSINLLTWNLELSDNSWVTGSNVILRQLESGGTGNVTPDGSQTAFSVVWVNGSGNTQLLKRGFDLEAGQNYQLRLILQNTGGRATPESVVRMVGDVVGSPSVSLSELNDYEGSYRSVLLSFETVGKQPRIPDPVNANFEIVAVSPDTATLAELPNIVADDFDGATLQINGISGNFAVVNNTASDGSDQVVVTVDSVTSLATAGVTVGDRCQLIGPSLVSVDLEIYSESTLSLLWGGAKLEQGDFYTSLNFQRDSIKPLGQTTLEWQPKDNPIIDLTTFGFLGELREWRGDGNVVDFGDLTINIDGGKMVVDASGTTLADPDALPPSPRFFVQVSKENTSISLFINGVLKARSGLSTFSPTSNPLILTSKGIRHWREFIVYGDYLPDGNPTVGQEAGQDVLRLFDLSTPLIPPVLISAQIPNFTLGSIEVPPPPAPDALTTITSITGNDVSVIDASNFSANDYVAVVRKDGKEKRVLGVGNIFSIAANVITFSGPVPGWDKGDELIIGDPYARSQTFIRFPYVPADEVEITEVNTGSRYVTVPSTLAFVANKKAFIRDPATGQDKGEVRVEDIDGTNERLTLDNVDVIEVGYTIAQPVSELLIHPDNTWTELLTPVPGVRIGVQSKNGLMIENETNGSKTVTPRLSLYL